MNSILFIFIALFSFSKDAEKSLRPQVDVPKVEGKSLNLEQYKNLKVPAIDKKGRPNCVSSSGQHVPDSPEYETCMQDRMSGVARDIERAQRNMNGRDSNYPPDKGHP